MEINKGGDYERTKPSSLFSRNQEGRGGDKILCKTILGDSEAEWRECPTNNMTEWAYLSLE